MRRFIFTTLWVLGCAVMASTAVAAADWPRFLGPTGDGRSAEDQILLEWGPKGPPVLFKKAVGDGYSMPVAAGGKLFLFDRHGDQERLTCLDALTGDEVWRASSKTGYVDTYNFSGGPRSAPLVDGDRVYTFGVEGLLSCRSVADGKLIWSVDTTKKFDVSQNFFGVGGSPIVEGELLLVPVGGTPPASSREAKVADDAQTEGGGSAVVAFDKLTGAVRYTTGRDQASYATLVIATVGQQRMGFMFARSGLFSFDVATGAAGFEYPWRAKTVESVNAASPIVSGNQVLISEGYGPGSAMLRLTDGKPELVWRDPPKSRETILHSHWATPVLHEETLYGCSGRRAGNAEVRAVDWATGKVLWRHPGLGMTTLTYAAGHLLVLTERGRLLLVEATREAYREVGSTGEEPIVAFPAWHPPVLSNGVLYVKGKDHLVALDLRVDPSDPKPETRESKTP